jgi:hypothetical protein
MVGFLRARHGLSYLSRLHTLTSVVHFSHSVPRTVSALDSPRSAMRQANASNCLRHCIPLLLNILPFLLRTAQSELTYEEHRSD